MATMTDTKQILKLLREVKKEKGYSLDQILKLIEDNGDFVSKSTLSRLFSDSTEDTDFRYETTIRPVADALLDLENFETNDDTDVRAFKAILKLKKDIITEMKQEMEHEKISYHEKLEEETAKFQRSLDFLRNQISLKDARIDKLMDSNERLSKTNDKLINQLMDCPLRKCE